MKIKYLAVALLAVACISCHNEPLPEGVMDEATMVSFLTDAYMLEGAVAIKSGNRQSEQLPQIKQGYQEILNRYEVSQQDVEVSMDYYAHRAEQYQAIHDQVKANIETLQNSDK